MYRATSKACRAAIPSFGFSGAGFLTSYHLGAAKCLVEHGWININGANLPMLTGVSGGALAIAAVASGVDPEVGMSTTLAVAARTQQEGILDAFQPGFSLLDQVEGPFLKDVMDAVNGDTELLLRRIQGGKLLRIGLTNPQTQPYMKNPKAYCFVDQYRDAEDILAACMLSSFIAGVTGPYSGSSPTMTKASQKLREMAQLGYIKKQQYEGGEIIAISLSAPAKGDNHFPPFLDGGLSNGFPVIDRQTVVVTPLRGRFDPNRWICPSPLSETDTDNEERLLEVSKRVRIFMDRQNAQTFRRMILSSSESELQLRYAQGYEDAKRFLGDHNLETVHKSFMPRVDPPNQSASITN